MALASDMQNSTVLSKTDFSFLDQLDFRRKYSLGTTGNSIRFYIAGIRCGKCVRKLEDLTYNLPGLVELRVEMGKNLALAEVDPKVLSFSQLAEKISELGFTPIPISSSENEEEIQRREDRSDVIRLAVAGACAGNIMTFSFAIYLGETGRLFPLFSWLCFTLYLPVLTYVALPFYKGALNSLKQRQLSIDLPMAIASVAGFVFSSVELLRGKADIYFDSLSGFLFLILAARLVQKKMQRKYLRPEELSETLRLERVRKLEGDSWIWSPLEVLKEGDRILLRSSETLPAEAEINSDSGQFSLAWLSGEINARTFLKNSVVPAGARLESEEATFTVRKLLGQTGFGQILQEVQRFSLAKNRIVSRADRWAQWLLGSVFTIAVIFLVSYWPESREEAISRALALIILACPCAMAFGTPLALASALRKAQRAGLVIRDANVFEKTLQLKTVFFDKTGTLTETALSLKENPADIPAVYRKIILSLENKSFHPIAFAFRRSFPAPGPLLEMENYRETPGIGVSAYIFGRHYAIRRSLNSEAVIGCTFFEDQKALYSFTFDAEIKPDALTVLSHLRSRGLRVVLLSGDKRESVVGLAQKLHFEIGDIFAEMKPEQKAAMISVTPHSMMIGDGVNDSLAMIKSDVSVASSGGMETALKSAGVYLTDPSLSGIRRLFEISESSLGLIRQNLTISVLYNLTGGILALTGYVNPLVAALLMPLSSGFILLSTWWRGRR